MQGHLLACQSCTLVVLVLLVCESTFSPDTLLIYEISSNETQCSLSTVASSAFASTVLVFCYRKSPDLTFESTLLTKHMLNTDGRLLFALSYAGAVSAPNSSLYEADRALNNKNHSQHLSSTQTQSGLLCTSRDITIVVARLRPRLIITI